MRSLNELGVAEAAVAIATGDISSEALVSACLERIEARDPVVGAWQYLDFDQALAAARRCDAAGPKGPLAGVPIGVKDIIDTVDMPTGDGSPIYRDYRPGWDAACVALAKAAGAIVLGKTVATEFAYFFPGKTANPHNPKHTPGGSSSGSAAAVVDFMVPAAFGTQTAASITRPASFCGVVGYKPSWNAFSLAGIKPFAPSFDTLGTLTRSVEDAALMRRVLLALPDKRAVETSCAVPRIGLCRTPWWPAATSDTRAAIERTAEILASAGADVADVTLPGEFAELAEAQKTIMAFEAARSLAHQRLIHCDHLSQPLRYLLETGLAVSYEVYAAAQTQAIAGRRAIAGLFGRWDALLARSAPGEAPEGLSATGDPLFSRMWTLLHVPSVTLPGHTGGEDLPVGIQIVGADGTDDRLLATARWVEARVAPQDGF